MESDTRLNLKHPAHFPLSDFSIIELEGPDSDAFLQGQLTVNMTRLANGQARLCAGCDAKGKMSGLGHVYRFNEKIWLVTHKENAQDWLSQLKKFAVFSNTEITDVSEHWLGWAILDADKQQDESKLTAPHYSVPLCDGLKFSWHSNTEDCQLNASNHLYDGEVLNAYFIRSGIPLLRKDMSHQWVPQMLNLQALDGIDFDKGCYMGQEVVARTRYLGKNKRALYTFVASTNLTNEVIGESVERQLGENWRNSGTVINAASHDNQTWLSVVLPNDLSTNNKLRLSNHPELKLSQVTLPYTIADETSAKRITKR